MCNLASKKAILAYTLLLTSFPLLAQENPNTVTTSENTAQVVQEPTQTNPQRDYQRQLYQKIQQLLPYADQANAAFLISQLLTKIENYPLYPDTKFQLLVKNNDLSFKEIEIFAQQYPQMSEQINRLKQHWLQQAQKKQNWQEILQLQSQLPKDLSSQCILLEAGYNQTNLDKTAWQQQVQQLWLTGKALPANCSALITNWQKAFLNADLLQQKALLASAKNNGKLLSELKSLAEQTEQSQWFEELIKVQQQPEYLLSPQSWFNPANPNFQQALAKQIFIQKFPHLIKKMKENSPQDPFQPYAELAKALQLESQEIAQWKKGLISQLFDSENKQTQQWRDNNLIELKEDNLTERRIRSAIREKQDYSAWLALLSEQAKQKEEWQFWQAKYWQQQGKSEQAKQIFQQLQSKRGFYPMLASIELKQPYQPQIQGFTTSQEQNITQHFANELDRISEFRWLADQTNMNREWKALLEKGDFAHKLQLADYAQQQQWFDLSVEATIQAKAWDFLALRLPNAYLDFFDIHLANKQISRTFAMAIARQESAWKPYVSSSANAKGLMQLLPSTAKQTAQLAKLPYQHEKQLFDPFHNIMLGTAHLQRLYDKYGNNRILIAAAYNAGAHRVEQWLARSKGKLSLAEFVASIPFFETRGYVQNVLTYDAYYQILQNQPQRLLYPQESQRLY